jgi:hypothetical protein
MADNLSPTSSRVAFFSGPVDVGVSVLFLLFARGPSAIFRAVIAVIVNALNRHAFRSRSHIGQERIEGLLPTFADGNAATAISVIVGKGRIAASVSHCLPRFVLGRVRSPVLADAINLKATATSVFTACQVSNKSATSIAAYAPAQVSALLATFRPF